MSLRVADVLALKLLKDAGARSLTDPALLERSVNWVHSSEIPDIARFLRGGELLLTAGIGMGYTEKSQREFVTNVSEAGAAAIVIEESGRMFEKVPDAVVDEGAARGIAVIALTEEVPFAGVSAEVHSILSELRVKALTREREIETEFSDLLLRGADAFGISQALSDTLDAAVVVENIAHRVVAHTGGESDDLDGWERHARSRHIDDGTCVYRPILTRGQPWGWIHVLKNADADLPDESGFAAERAAAAIAISLLTDRTREAREGQRTASLVSRLMLGEISGPEFIQYAKRLGFQLDSERAIVAIANKDPRDELDTAVLRKNTRLISADMGEYAIAISRSLGTDIDIQRLFPGSVDGIGVSRKVGVRMLATAVAQARNAATVARSLGKADVLRFDTLGVERILVSLAQGPELASFVEDELGTLLAKDARSSTPLLPTLRAYLEVDGRKSEAADMLFIQRRTLYNRLARISEVLGRSLEDSTVRQSLLLAVKGLDLLEGSRSTARRWPRSTQ